MIILTLDPVWTGDLDDDCHAEWNGMLLHCEAMHDDVWWWCVSAAENGRELAACYDNDQPRGRPSTGADAREACLAAARKLLRGES